MPLEENFGVLDEAAVKVKHHRQLVMRRNPCPIAFELEKPFLLEAREVVVHHHLHEDLTGAIATTWCLLSLAMAALSALCSQKTASVLNKFSKRRTSRKSNKPPILLAFDFQTARKKDILWINFVAWSVSLFGQNEPVMTCKKHATNS